MPTSALSVVKIVRERCTSFAIVPLDCHFQQSRRPAVSYGGFFRCIVRSSIHLEKSSAPQIAKMPRTRRILATPVVVLCWDFMNRIGNIHVANLLTVVSSLLLMGCAAKIPPPEKTIEELYAPYVSHAAERGESSWEKAPVYSKSFKAAIDRGFEYSLLLNEPVIDYDPVANAQDFAITNLHIEVDQPPAAGKAHVIARFNNLERTEVVGYDMILEDGKWKIDAIRSTGQDLRQSIIDALKTLGDPEAMKAPVEKIYARYKEGPKIEPLYLWAPLTNDLRDKLKEAAARSVVLGFDPVCGGSAGVPADVKLEAASGGVIARFRIDQQDRVAVFDVVKNQGAWSVDDIHGPGKPSWDLVQKLAAAGIH